MKLIFYVLFLASAFFVAPVVSAQANSIVVHSVIAGCRSVAAQGAIAPDQKVNAGYCLGTINGFVGLDALNEFYGRQRFFCPGDGLVAGEYVSAFVAYVDANPSALGLDLNLAVLNALRAVFPCPAQN